MRKTATLALALIGGIGAVSAVSVPQAGSPYTRSGDRNAAQTQQPSDEGAFTVTHRRAEAPRGEFGFPSAGTAFNNTSRHYRAPQRTGAAGGTMYGWVDYDGNETVPQGFVEVDVDGTVRSIVPAPKVTATDNFVVSASYVRDGKIVIMGTEQQKAFFGWLNNGKYVYEYDFAGNRLSQYSIPNYSNVSLFTTFAYDAEHDIIYGQTHNAQGYQVRWGYASGANPSQITWTANQTNVEDVLYALTFNQVTGKIVGIKANGDVVEVNPANGAMTKIGAVTPSEYETAIAYSPYDGGYYYGLCSEAQSAIQLLDGEDFSVIATNDLGRLFEFMSFYTQDVQKIMAAAPGESQYLGDTFAKGSHDGRLRYRLASSTHAGTPIMGNVNWVLTMDGTELRRGTAPAGSEVEIKLTDIEEGMHTFVFTASLAGLEGRYNTQEFYIGNDTPVAPSGVRLTEATISWDAVDEGVHAGWVDPAQITYNVYLNDRRIASGIKTTSCPSGLTSDDTINLWEASVEAVFDGKVSEKGTSNDIVYGEPMHLPVEIAPAVKESRLFTITDNNFSPGEFKFIDGMLDAEEHFTGFQYAAGSYAANDWLYLPPVEFTDAEAVYRFDMNVFRTNFQKEESFEVKVLTDINPNSAVATVMENGPITDTQDNNYTHIQGGYFQVPSAGKYYIGIHMTSAARAGIAWFRNFSVTKDGNTTGSCPAAPTAVSAKGAEQGALNADVTLTLPTLTINGSEIPADAVLNACVGAPGKVTRVQAKPGETVTVNVPTAQGLNEIEAWAEDSQGRAGLSASTTVYTGVDYPGLLDISYDLSEDNLTLILNWEPVSTGANGGYVTSTGVDYYLVGLISNQWQVVGRVGTDVYTCRVNAPKGSGPAIYTYGIIPVNVAGQAPMFSYVSAIMCEPYQMPFLSDYKNRKVQGYTYNRANNSAATATGNPSARFPAFSTPDNANAYYAYQATGAQYPLTYNVCLSKVSTLGSKNAVFELGLYGGSCDSFDIVASANGVAPEIIKTVTRDDVEEGPAVLKVQLPEKFQDKGWVEINLQASLPQGQTVIVYSYAMYDDLDNDFGVYEISGPVKAGIGEECKYTAWFRNYGNKDAAFPGGSWNVTDGEGNVIAAVELPADTEVTAAGSTLSKEISFTPTADEAGNITVAFALAPGDEKDSNDRRSLDVEIGQGSDPAVTDLHAEEITFSDVTLAWTNPDHSGPVIQSFEDEEPFVLDSGSETVGGFKRHDGDGAFRYTLGGAVGKIPNATEPASFVVWSSSQIDQIMGSKDIVPAAEGDKYLVAFCPQIIEGLSGASADDWLISPELVPGSDFSFWLRSITFQYQPEEVSVMYSTRSDDPEDFVELGKIEITGEGLQGIWKQYSYSLPKDAKYFALRYTSYDKMGIAVDDLRYSPKGSDIEVTSFDIYRDGVRIAENIGAVEFVDDNVGENTEYTYNVMPRMSNGRQGLMSNTLRIRTTGIDGIATDGTDGAEYYDLKGVRIYGKLAPGVYLRRSGSEVRKIVIAK